jgi:predicted enzyme related to lactoylglutathione lyase
MTTGMKTVVYPVRDAAAAREYYRTLLGVDPHSDTPYYVGFTVGGQEIGLDPHGHAKGMTGPVGYWHVDAVRPTVDRLVAAGAELAGEVTDVGGGTLMATLTDPDGNVLGLIQKP